MGLCAAATVAHALDLAVSAHLARLGVVALFVTPPLRLAVVASGFWADGSRRHALAAGAVLAALLGAAARATL